MAHGVSPVEMATLPSSISVFIVQVVDFCIVIISISKNYLTPGINFKFVFRSLPGNDAIINCSVYYPNYERDKN